MQLQRGDELGKELSQSFFVHSCIVYPFCVMSATIGGHRTQNYVLTAVRLFYFGRISFTSVKKKWPLLLKIKYFYNSKIIFTWGQIVLTEVELILLQLKKTGRTTQY